MTATKVSFRLSFDLEIEDLRPSDTLAAAMATDLAEGLDGLAVELPVKIGVEIFPTPPLDDEGRPVCIACGSSELLLQDRIFRFAPIRGVRDRVLLVSDEIKDDLDSSHDEGLICLRCDQEMRIPEDLSVDCG